MESTKTEMDTKATNESTSTLACPDLAVCADHELLAMFQRTRDAAAFTVLVQRHHAIIFGIAHRMLGCPHTAEDVVQATFLVLAKDSRKIRNRHSLVSWLYGVAYRISARTARQQAKTTVSTLEDKVMVTADPLDRLNAQFEQHAVFEEVHRLPEPLRAPLVMRYLNGKTNKQVAAELKLSETAVEGRLKRGRMKLRLRLARKGVTFGFAIGFLGFVRNEAAAIELPNLATSTLTAAFNAESVSGTTLETGLSNQVTRMAEEEIFKMATAKFLSITVMTGIVVGVIASGWALAGDSTRAQNDGSNTEVVLENVSDPGASSTGLLTASLADDLQDADPATKSPASNVSETISESDSRAINELTIQERLEKLGHYSVDALDEKAIDILEKMQKRSSFDYFETPLSDVAQRISEDYKVQILFNEPALSDAGIEPGTELVTLSVQDIKLDTALKLMLDKMHLTAIVRNEVLMITSKDTAYDTLVTRIYDLRPNWNLSLDELMETILKNVAASSWEDNGGNGTITLVTQGLVITASLEVHGEINQLLVQFDRLYKEQQ